VLLLKTWPYFLKKDVTWARAAFAEAVPLLGAGVEKRPQDPRLHSALAEAHAGTIRGSRR